MSPAVLGATVLQQPPWDPVFVKLAALSWAGRWGPVTHLCTPRGQRRAPPDCLREVPEVCVRNLQQSFPAHHQDRVLKFCCWLFATSCHQSLHKDSKEKRPWQSTFDTSYLCFGANESGWIIIWNSTVRHSVCVKLSFLRYSKTDVKIPQSSFLLMWTTAVVAVATICCSPLRCADFQIWTPANSSTYCPCYDWRMIKHPYPPSRSSCGVNSWNLWTIIGSRIGNWVTD